MAEDRLAALEREVRLLREGFNRLAADQRAESERAEQRHQERLLAVEGHNREVAGSIDRLAEALQEYCEARLGTGGPAVVRPLPPRPPGKGAHRS